MIESDRNSYPEQNNLCGKDELDLHKCTLEDLDELQALSESVNWNQLPADWRNFIELGGVWCMKNLDRIVGTAAWIPRSSSTVWIGVVITKPEWRGRSIATKLMKKIIEESSCYDSRLLDASAMGEPVYRKLGFKEMYIVSRMGIGGICTPSRLSWKPVSEDDVKKLFPGDPLPMQLFKNAPELCKIAENNGKILGYFMGRYGLKSVHFGPLYAENTAIAIDAVNEMRAIAGNAQVTMDIMGYQKDFINLLLENGADLKRDFTRMYHGKYTCAENPEMFAAAGPEYG